jgi:predicted ATPase/DNA-binding SARP family transcriptional activator
VDAAAVPEPPEPALRVDLLGPLRLRVRGVEVDVPGSRRRALLALLALADGRTVGVDAIVAALWPEEPPAGGTQALHSHVSRLRGHLGPEAHRLRRDPAGYALRLAVGELDVAAARAAAATDDGSLPRQPTQVLRQARRALDLWRGEALEEFAEFPPLAADAVGLAEVRRRLRDDALGARLALGDASALPDAAAAASEEPLREPAVLLWVRALAMQGRTSEAMQAAAAYRRRLADETGLDPGPALAALEHEVAAGALAPSAPGTARRTVARPGSPLVGRDGVRAELRRLVSHRTAVTVTGPGGVGKTRLALEVAADHCDDSDGAAVLVPLATVTEPERVPDAVASTLDLRLSAGASTVSVAEALRAEALLLVLDNCEHVLPACRELVAALQQRAPRMRVLATSRSTLHVPDEHVVRLQPLPLPRNERTVDALTRQPSARAFLEHAQRRQPSFALQEDDVEPVIDILRRLDGLPLALELAAGQLSVLSPRALRDRLGRLLDVLHSDRPSPDERHTTLRRTIAWSDALLQPVDRTLLRALEPFAGGVDLATVESLAAEVTPGSEPVVVLSRLVDASLIAPTEDRSTRYHVLETVRAYLRDEVDEHGERAAVDDRFLRWALSTAKALGARLLSLDEVAADRRLRGELANLRAARDLARRRGDLDTWIGITLALDDAAIWRDIRELWTWSSEVFADPAVAGHPQVVAVIGSAAEAAWLLGDLPRADALAREGIALAEATGAPDAQARRCWGADAAVALFRGDYERAQQRYERAAALHPPQATPYLATAALAACYASRHDDAAALLDRARRAAEAHPSLTGTAYLHYATGELLARDDAGRALGEYQRAVELAKECGSGFVAGIATVGLASVWTASGDVAAAAGGYRVLLAYWLETGNSTQLWTTARNAAALLAEHGGAAPAAVLLAAADAHPSASAGDRAVTEALASVLRRSLGPTGLSAAQAEARVMSPGQVVESAREALLALV